MSDMQKVSVKKISEDLQEIFAKAESGAVTIEADGQRRGVYMDDDHFNAIQAMLNFSANADRLREIRQLSKEFQEGNAESYKIPSFE